VDQDALDFLALLCDELGDKDAVIRAYQRWVNGDRIEREKESSFDPARQVKVVDEQGHVRILYKSWASEVARKAREDEEKQSLPCGCNY
jgi:hypothetical protein